MYLLDQGYMIPVRLSKFIVNIGPPVIFYLIREYHTDLYTYIEGEKWA